MSRSKPQFKTMSAVEIMSDFQEEPNWVVKRILPPGLSILAGNPKSGKSWMTLSLCLSIASGEDALGGFQTSKGEVLYLSYEGTRDQMGRRMRQLIGYTVPPLDLQIVPEDILTVRTGGLEAIKNWLEESSNPKLVAIDTLQLFYGISDRRGNAYELDYEKMRPLKALADKYDVSILLVHHLNKSKVGDSFEAISGSHGITGSVDTMWVLNNGHHSKSAMLSISGREVERAHFLLDNQGKMDWIVTGEDDGMNLSPERQEIFDLLASEDEPLGPTDIANALQKNRSTVSGLLSSMIKKDIIVQTAYGRYMVPKDNAKPTQVDTIDSSGSDIDSDYIDDDDTDF